MILLFEIIAVPFVGAETDVTVNIPFSGSVSLETTFIVTLLQADVVAASAFATGTLLLTVIRTIAVSQAEGDALSHR